MHKYAKVKFLNKDDDFSSIYYEVDVDMNVVRMIEVRENQEIEMEMLSDNSKFKSLISDSFPYPEEYDNFSDEYVEYSPVTKEYFERQWQFALRRAELKTL